ncbi:hypothetical protein Tco_1495087 [Tanacetum coccineum]
MRELREDTFSGNKDEDAHDHIDRVLSIIGIFNIPRVSKDAVMLRVFPFTLTGSAKRWVDRLAPGTINTWDLLKKAFIQRYCPPSMTAKQLKDIHSFKKEGDESLYQAWERYNDLLYKCPLSTASIIIKRSTEMEEWNKKLQENAEINTRNQSASLKNLETQIKQLTKEIHADKILNSSPEQIKTVTSD